MSCSNPTTPHPRRARLVNVLEYPMPTTVKASRPDKIAMPRRPQWVPKSIWALVRREIRDARLTSDRAFSSDSTSIWIGLAAHHYLVSRAVNDRKIGTLLHLVARWGTTVSGQSFAAWSSRSYLGRANPDPRWGHVLRDERGAAGHDRQPSRGSATPDIVGLTALAGAGGSLRAAGGCSWSNDMRFSL